MLSDYARTFDKDNDVEAKKAISHLNGVMLEGKPIRVEESGSSTECVGCSGDELKTR
jgi:hypothetical protein